MIKMLSNEISGHSITLTLTLLISITDNLVSLESFINRINSKVCYSLQSSELS